MWVALGVSIMWVHAYPRPRAEAAHVWPHICPDVVFASYTAFHLARFGFRAELWIQGRAPEVCSWFRAWHTQERQRREELKLFPFSLGIGKHWEARNLICACFCQMSWSHWWNFVFWPSLLLLNIFLALCSTFACFSHLFLTLWGSIFSSEPS